MANDRACFIFDKNSIHYRPNVGETTSIEVIGVEGDTAPYPTYRRGLWFNGQQYMEVLNLLVNPVFRMDMFVKVPTDSGGTLFSIATYPDFTNLLNVQIVAGFGMQIF